MRCWRWLLPIVAPVLAGCPAQRPTTQPVSVESASVDAAASTTTGTFTTIAVSTPGDTDTSVVPEPETPSVTVMLQADGSTTLEERDFDGDPGVLALAAGQPFQQPVTRGDDELPSKGRGNTQQTKGPGVTMPTKGPGGQTPVAVSGEVGPGLGRDAVRQVIQSQAVRLKGCHDRLLLGTAAEAAGRVSIRFQVEPSGIVRAAEVSSATITDPTFIACVRRVVENLRFPTADAPTIVTYPFRFESSSAGE